MHEVHDHTVALARLFQGPPFRLNSVLDLEVVKESLGGDALSSFGNTLWSFGLCDDPNRYSAIYVLRKNAENVFMY